MNLKDLINKEAQVTAFTCISESQQMEERARTYFSRFINGANFIIFYLQNLFQEFILTDMRIKQVAQDKSNYEWADWRHREIFEDGFEEGARWVRSEIKRELFLKKE